MRINATRSLLGAALLLASAAAGAETFAGSGTGNIPDAPSGLPNCGVNNVGTPRVVTFDVNGMVNPLVSINLSMLLRHTWRGDLVVILAAPGGTPSQVVFSHTGSNVPNGCGHDGDVDGLYEFGDLALRDWWVFAHPTTPVGLYRPAAPGGVEPGGQPVNFAAKFRGLTPAQSNGTWTLSVADAGDQGVGSIDAATLVIDQSDILFKNGFEAVTP